MRARRGGDRAPTRAVGPRRFHRPPKENSTIRPDDRSLPAPAAGPRINERIRIREVRLIDHEGKQVGVVPTEQAMAMALEAGLDLVEVAPNVRPPVCKIMDFGKYKYEQNKKAHESKVKQHKTAGDKLPDGSYVTDFRVDTPSDTGYSAPVARCQYPYQVTPGNGANQRGKDWEMQGSGLLAQMGAWWRQAPEIEAVAGIGFPVLGQ